MARPLQYFKGIRSVMVTPNGEIMLSALVNGKTQPDTFILYVDQQSEEMTMDYKPAEFDTAES